MAAPTTSQPGLVFNQSSPSARRGFPSGQTYSTTVHPLVPTNSITSTTYTGPTTINYSYTGANYAPGSNWGAAYVTFNPVTNTGVMHYGATTLNITCNRSWKIFVPGQSYTGTFDPKTGSINWSNGTHWHI